MLSKVLTGTGRGCVWSLPLATLLGHPWGLGQYLSPSHPLQPGLQSSSGCLGSDLEPRERGTWCSTLLEMGRVTPSPLTQDLPVADLSSTAVQPGLWEATPCYTDKEVWARKGQRGRPVSFSKGQVLLVSPSSDQTSAGPIRSGPGPPEQPLHCGWRAEAPLHW